MIKTLIFESNINKLTNIINTINNRNKEINIRYIATTMHEVKNVILKEDINLVLFFQEGLELSQRTDKYIEELSKIKNIKIIYFFKDKKYAYVKNKNENIFFLNNNDSLENLCKKVEKIILNNIWDETIYNIRRKIVLKLIELGYNLKYKGTFYLIDAIEYCYTNNKSDTLNNLEKNVYVHVAKKYNKSLNNIKTNIIKATQMIEERYTTKNEYYTPKLVIILMLLHLKEITQ